MENQQSIIPPRLLKFMNLAGNAIMMNLLFIAASIPIVTIGPAWCGLMGAVRYNIRGEKWITGFSVGYKTRFWRSLLAWIVMLVPIIYMLGQIDGAYAAVRNGYTNIIPQLVSSSVVFLLLGMFVVALLLLNVYIHTSVGNWINNAARMLTGGHIFLLGSAVLFWLPVVMGVLWGEYLFFSALVFIALYFVLSALVITILMKNTLIDFLTEARIEGTLISEEGKQETEDEEDEDEEEEV